VLSAWPAALSSAQSLTIDTTRESLKIRTHGFSFLKGHPLARLKDGQSVRVELTVMVLPAPGQPEAATIRRIFSVSYDLWEERFAVTTVDKRSQSITHLAQPAAEAWCIEQLNIPLTALGTLGRDRPFWIRLEYRILDADGTPEHGQWEYTIQALIDILSRRRSSSRTESAPQAIEAGPFKLPTQGSRFRTLSESLTTQTNQWRRE
jgi:hypothetical protein